MFMPNFSSIGRFCKIGMDHPLGCSELKFSRFDFIFSHYESLATSLPNFSSIGWTWKIGMGHPIGSLEMKIFKIWLHILSLEDISCLHAKFQPSTTISNFNPHHSKDPHRSTTWTILLIFELDLCICITYMCAKFQVDRISLKRVIVGPTDRQTDRQTSRVHKPWVGLKINVVNCNNYHWHFYSSSFKYLVKPRVTKN